MPALYDEDGVTERWRNCCCMRCARRRRCPVRADPQDRQLARLCKAFLKSPSIQATPQAWAQRLHKSLRTFTRFFHQQTGMSFGAWRQQACLLAALPRLSAGQSVTQVALDLGYDSPSAFSSMFKRRLGKTPMGSSANPTRPHPGRGFRVPVVKYTSPSRCKHAAAGRFCLVLTPGAATAALGF